MYYQLDLLNTATEIPSAQPRAMLSQVAMPVATVAMPAYSLLAQRAGGLSADEIARAVTEALGALKVYVVESEITSTQNRIKTIVEQASF